MAKTTEIDRIVGANLRRMREGVGMSLDGMGTACGISAQMLSRYEKGQARFTAGQLVHLGQIIGCGIMPLLDGVKEVATKMEAEIGKLPPSVQEALRLLMGAISAELARKMGGK